ncbi:hypothetical protein EN813_037695 [Mesorhizobium sp. M00.F.Ca.ET.170.01.1.1]|nr:hypothetical protein EN813_037695 [Mesorhizobium sp. M00.F.Ca.ET.170.01.1.1]
MARDLFQIVDSLWQSADRQAAARKVQSTLDTAQKARLEQIARVLRDGAARRRSGGDAAQQPTKLDGAGIEGLLTLLTLAVYHSDGLSYLPIDEREKRLQDWAKSTGYSAGEVREACALGPQGLRPLLRAS